MINRTYFYSGKIYTGGGFQPFDGVITSCGWFPAQAEVLKQAYNDIFKVFKAEEKNVCIEVFNRV